MRLSRNYTLCFDEFLFTEFKKLETNSIHLHGLGVGVVAAVVECTAVVGLVVVVVVVDAAVASDASVAFAEVDAVVVGILAAEHAALAFVVFEAELVLVLFEIVAAGDD